MKPRKNIRPPSAVPPKKVEMIPVENPPPPPAPAPSVGLKALPIDKWQTFVPDGNLDTVRKSLLSNGCGKNKLPLNIEEAHVPQTQVKATSDVTFNMLNQAAVNMVRNVSVNPEAVIEPLERKHKHDLSVKAVIKQDKKAAKKKTLAVVKTTSPAAVAPVKKKQKTVNVPPQPTLDELPIEVLEQHNRRDDQLALFTSNMERMSKPINDIVINTPPTTAVLAYCAKYKQEFPWFVPMQNLVTNSDTYDYPDVDLMRRATLQQFLFEPDPRKSWERHCFNLDREAHPHEMRVRCIAHVMSEQKLGPGKGYRLRELLLSDTQAKVQYALKNKKDPTIHLEMIPELCFLCHLWTALRDCTHQRDKADEREQKDMTDETNPNVVIINKFMVDIDLPGEYDRTKMLSSDKVSMGIWGPLPIFNESNYVPTTVAGLRGFEETNKLLFRPTRALLPRIESQNQSASTRSNPTVASSATTNSPH